MSPACLVCLPGRATAMDRRAGKPALDFPGTLTKCATKPPEQAKNPSMTVAADRAAFFPAGFIYSMERLARRL